MFPYSWPLDYSQPDCDTTKCVDIFCAVVLLRLTRGSLHYKYFLWPNTYTLLSLLLYQSANINLLPSYIHTALEMVVLRLVTESQRGRLSIYFHTFLPLVWYVFLRLVHLCGFISWVNVSGEPWKIDSHLVYMVIASQDIPRPKICRWEFWSIASSGRTILQLNLL